MEWGLLNGPDRLELEGGLQLRLLSAFEVLQARGEARVLAGEERELALCANACLLSKAVFQGETPRFRDGEQVLREWTVEEIGRLAKLWLEFNRKVNPGPGVGEDEVDKLKKAWHTPERSGCTGVCCGTSQPCPRRNESGR